MKKTMILLLAAALLSVTQTACRSTPSLAGTPPDMWHIPKIKVALYLDVGCKGGGVIHWAQLLQSSPEVAAGRNYTAQLAIVQQMTGRNRAAQLAIVKQMSRH